MKSVAIKGACTLTRQAINSLEKQFLILGDGVDLAHNNYFNKPNVIYPKCAVFKVKMDAYSYIHHNSTVINAEIGRYCSLGHELDIGMGYHHYKATTTSPTLHSQSPLNTVIGKIDHKPKWLIDRHGEETNHVKIGHDVWVGGHVMIPNDVTIGTGAVLGAGAVITKDVPPYAVINARGEHVKNRFSDEIITDLMASEWWQYDLPSMISQKLIDPRIQEDPKILLQVMKDSDTNSWLRIKEDWHALLIFGENKVMLTPIDPNTDQNFTTVSLSDEMYESIFNQQ